MNLGSMNKHPCDIYIAECDFLPLNVIVDYWCERGDAMCREFKRSAIIAACAENKILYRRNDGKDWNDPPHSLADRGILDIKVDSFMEWSNQMFPQAQKPDIPISTREKNTLLIIIAALCEIAGKQANERGMATDIAAETARLGHSRSDDCIRGYLKQAADLITPR